MNRRRPKIAGAYIPIYKSLSVDTCVDIKI
jgi:hypothetical protein